MSEVLPPAWVTALKLWDDHATVTGFTAPTRRRRRRYVERVALASGLVDPWSATTGGLEAALRAAGMPPVLERDARGALRHFYGWGCASGRIGHDPARVLTSAAGPPCVEAQRPAVHVRAALPPRTPIPALNVAWSAAVARWEDYCVAGGQSPATVRLRRHRLAHLGVVCPSPWAATPEQLVAFLAVPGWSPETRRTARGAVRSFYRWATLAGHVEVDPARALPSVRVPAATPRPAPDDVVAGAYARAGDRERLMLDLALVLGLRRSEVAQVHSDHVEGDCLRVLGKGGRSRLLPVPAELLARLRDRPRGYAFPRHDGRAVSAWVVGDTLRSLLGPGWSGHTLRHAAATRWYASTGDVLIVSKLLGHARPETSARYAQVPDDAMRRAVGL